MFIDNVAREAGSKKNWFPAAAAKLVEMFDNSTRTPTAEEMKVAVSDALANIREPAVDLVCANAGIPAGPVLPAENVVGRDDHEKGLASVGVMQWKQPTPPPSDVFAVWFAAKGKAETATKLEGLHMPHNDKCVYEMAKAFWDSLGPSNKRVGCTVVASYRCETPCKTNFSRVQRTAVGFL